jgi:hypothetical protein
MSEIDLFDYFPSLNNKYNQLLWVIAHDMNNFRILAKNERFRLGEKHMNIEIGIKRLDNELIVGNMTFNIYKKNYDELLKDIKITSDELEKAINAHLSCSQEYETCSSFLN